MPRKTMTTQNLSQTTDDPAPEAPAPTVEAPALPAPEAPAPVLVKVRALRSFADFHGREMSPRQVGEVFTTDAAQAAAYVRIGFVESV